MKTRNPLHLSPAYALWAFLLTFLALPLVDLLAAIPPPPSIPTPPKMTRNEHLEKRREDLRKMVADRKAQLEKERADKLAKAAPKPVPTPAPAAAVEPSFNTPDLVMMLKPFNQNVQSGTPFLTEVSLFSQTTQSYDQVNISIAYPHANIRPLRIFDYQLKDQLDPKRPPTINDKTGLLTYSADLAKTVSSLGSKPLLRIVWECAGDNPKAQLTLNPPGLTPERQSSVYRDDKNLLLSNSTIQSACINAKVVIADKNAGKNVIKDPRNTAQTRFTSALGSAALARDTEVKLSLKLSPKQPQTPNTFLLDVMVDNPNAVAFDQIRLAIGFDPKKARVLDWDYKNWIKSGVNVFDGHARHLYPFNVLIRNNVSNREGRIDYQMGNTTLVSRPSGCLIRIHCQALAPHAPQSFRLYPTDQERNWYTDVTARSRSVLQSPPTAKRHHPPKTIFAASSK